MATARAEQAEVPLRRERRRYKVRQKFNRSGSVAEWLKAAVLKTAVPRGTRGSNPLASAILLLAGQ